MYQMYLLCQLSRDDTSATIMTSAEILLHINIYYNHSIMPKHHLQLLLLLLIGCAASAVKITPGISMDVEQAQNVFEYIFCSDCYRDPGYTCDKNGKYLSQLSETGFFDISKAPIRNNPLNINFVDAYVVQSKQTYKFPSGKLFQKTHTSMVYTPREVKSLRGIIIYFHRWNLGKWNGPSSNTLEYQSIAALYVSQGYAVVIPDLIGFRNDSDPHPFLLYPQVSVRSAVSTLNDLVSFFTGFGSQTANLYSVGYGEGGSYALWLSKCVSFPELCPSYTLSRLPEHSLSLNPYYRLKSVASMDGALDLSRVTYDFLTKNVGTAVNSFMIRDQYNHNFAKGPLIASLLDSYLLYSQNIENELSSYIASDYFNLNCKPSIDQSFCDINKKRLNYTEAIKSNSTQSGLQLVLGLASLAQTYDGEKTPYLGEKLEEFYLYENNSVFSLASRQTIANQAFYNAFIDATIVDFAQKAPSPTFVWTLKYDSVISSNNTRNFYEVGRGNKFVSFYEFENSQYKVCEMPREDQDVDHDRAEILGNIFTLNFIQNNS